MGRFKGGVVGAQEGFGDARVGEGVVAAMVRCGVGGEHLLEGRGGPKGEPPEVGLALLVLSVSHLEGCGQSRSPFCLGV